MSLSVRLQVCGSSRLVSTACGVRFSRPLSLPIYPLLRTLPPLLSWGPESHSALLCRSQPALRAAGQGHQPIKPAPAEPLRSRCCLSACRHSQAERRATSDASGPERLQAALGICTFGFQSRESEFGVYLGVAQLPQTSLSPRTAACSFFPPDPGSPLHLSFAPRCFFPVLDQHLLFPYLILPPLSPYLLNYFHLFAAFSLSSRPFSSLSILHLSQPPQVIPRNSPCAHTLHPSLSPLPSL